MPGLPSCPQTGKGVGTGPRGSPPRHEEESHQCLHPHMQRVIGIREKVKCSHTDSAKPALAICEYHIQLPVHLCNMYTLCITVLCCCSEVNASFFYKSAEEREKLVAAERKFTDERVQKVIDLKKKVRSGGVGEKGKRDW